MERLASCTPDVTVSATDVGTKTAQVLDQAIRQPVGVTKHGRVQEGHAVAGGVVI